MGLAQLGYALVARYWLTEQKSLEAGAALRHLFRHFHPFSCRLDGAAVVHAGVARMIANASLLSAVSAVTVMRVTQRISLKGYLHAISSN